MGISETSLRSHTSTNNVQSDTKSTLLNTGSLLGGGKKRKTTKRVRSKHHMNSSNKKTMTGGFMSVIREALVPFGIFALQKRSQSSNAMHATNKTKKFRHFRKSYKKSNKRR